MDYLWIALGSAIGGVARHWVSMAVAERIGGPFPWGTILVNFSGSFAIGALAAFAGPDSRFLLGSPARLFLMVGVCGGYTTFSAFSLQTLDLMRDGDWARAAWNVALSVVVCLVAVWLGHAGASAISAR